MSASVRNIRTTHSQRVTRTALLSLIVLSSFGMGTATAAVSGTVSTQPKATKCVGAAERKQAQALRIQASQSDLAALAARRAAAVSKNNVVRVAKIDKRIAAVNARIVKIQTNQAKLTARCP
jgi:hypothetical protein